MHDLYDNARQAFGTQQLNWTTCNPFLWLLTTGYAGSPSHVFLSSVPASARLQQPKALLNIAMDRGIARADPITIGTEYVGAYVVGAVLYASTGNETTSRLIACYESVLGMPAIVPLGGSILQWDAVNGLFRV